MKDYKIILDLFLTEAEKLSNSKYLISIMPLYKGLNVYVHDLKRKKYRKFTINENCHIEPTRKYVNNYIRKLIYLHEYLEGGIK